MGKKGKNRDNPFRTLVDPTGRAEWLRDKGRGHPGFGELLNPGSGKRKKRHQEIVQQFRLKSDQYDAYRRRRLKKESSAAEHTNPVSTLEPKGVSQPFQQSDNISIESVPLPSDKVVAEQLSGLRIARDGQSEFRNLVLEAYRICCITACPDDTALQAAHIIPYVNRLSNVLPNGLCLRADIHYLFDRNLIRIDPSYVVQVSCDIQFAEYRKLQGCKLLLPDLENSFPSPGLLKLRSSLLNQSQH